VNANLTRSYHKRRGQDIGHFQHLLKSRCFCFFQLRVRICVSRFLCHSEPPRPNSTGESDFCTAVPHWSSCGCTEISPFWGQVNRWYGLEQYKDQSYSRRRGTGDEHYPPPPPPPPPPHPHPHPHHHRVWAAFSYSKPVTIITSCSLLGINISDPRIQYHVFTSQRLLTLLTPI
jgi:hypothetical protein